MKSFYASVECVERGLHPLKTSLCVMSRADNSVGLFLPPHLCSKRSLGKQMSVVPMTCPLISRRVNFPTTMPKKQGLRTDPAYVKFIEDWARVTVIVPPRMDKYIAVQHGNSAHFPELWQSR